MCSFLCLYEIKKNCTTAQTSWMHEKQSPSTCLRWSGPGYSSPQKSHPACTSGWWSGSAKNRCQWRNKTERGLVLAHLPHLQLLLCNDERVSLPLKLYHDRGAHCNLQSPCAKDTSPFIPTTISEHMHQGSLNSLGHVWRGDLLVRLLPSGPSLSCACIMSFYSFKLIRGHP